MPPDLNFLDSSFLIEECLDERKVRTKESATEATPNAKLSTTGSELNSEDISFLFLLNFRCKNLMSFFFFFFFF